MTTPGSRTYLFQNAAGLRIVSSLAPTHGQESLATLNAFFWQANSPNPGSQIIRQQSCSGPEQSYVIGRKLVVGVEKDAICVGATQWLKFEFGAVSLLSVGSGF